MRVILAEDSALLREGLVRLLRDVGVVVMAAVADATDLLAAVETAHPDLVLTDIRMPPTFTDEGILAAVDIRRRHPDVGVLVLSQYSEAAYAERLLTHGGSRIGYLLKDRVNDVMALHDALTRVHHGESVIDAEVVRTLVSRRRQQNPIEQLTERERAVLALMAEGRSNLGIGSRLHLSAKTVETHVRAILIKLDLPETPDDNRRVAAVVHYLRS